MPLPKAQESKLLQDLKADLSRGRIEDVFEIAGYRFRMHTLSDGEAIWRDTFVSVASNMAFLATRKTATLAAAISHINDRPVTDLFELPEDEQLIGYLKNNEQDRVSYYRESMLSFLSDLGDTVIAQMSGFFQGLEARRDEVLKNLKNSSGGTDSSGSSSTSSPDDGPPAVKDLTETGGSSFAT